MVPSSSSPQRASVPFFPLLALLIAASLSFNVAAYQLGGARGWGKKVGGWTDIPDAASNQEARDLGRFSVGEYNRQLRGPGESPVTFSGVLSGQRQVVSGFKYRLRISALDSCTGQSLSFDAVIFVRPWLPGRNHSSAPSSASKIAIFVLRSPFLLLLRLLDAVSYEQQPASSLCDAS